MEEPEDWRLGTILRPISAFQIFSVSAFTLAALVAVRCWLVVVCFVSGFCCWGGWEKWNRVESGGMGSS